MRLVWNAAQCWHSIGLGVQDVHEVSHRTDTMVMLVQMSARDAPNRTLRNFWHAGHSAIYIVGVGMLLQCIQVVAQSMSEAVQVETPEEFQEQVRKGTPHVIITQHLNMKDTPRFQETTTGMDDGMIAIVRSGNAITQTIRVRTDKQPTPSCLHTKP